MPTLKELSPALWFTMHTFAGAYPEKPTTDDKKSAVSFIYSLQHLFPCKKCAGHLSKWLESHPVEQSVDNREQFEKWVFDYHEDVNKQRPDYVQKASFTETQQAFRPGEWKPFLDYPFAKEVSTKVNKPASTTLASSNNATYIIIIIVVVVVLLLIVGIVFYFYFWRRKKQ